MFLKIIQNVCRIMEKSETIVSRLTPGRNGGSSASAYTWIGNMEFTAGELYLFRCPDPHRPGEGPLWGVFDRIEGGRVRLKSSSLDLKYFRVWHLLSDGYRRVRLATRAELRDYAMGFARYEYNTELHHLLDDDL